MERSILLADFRNKNIIGDDSRDLNLFGVRGRIEKNNSEKM